MIRRRAFSCSSAKLALHIDERLEHLIRDRNDLRVGLESALGNDHIRELIGDINV